MSNPLASSARALPTVREAIAAAILWMGESLFVFAAVLLIGMITLTYLLSPERYPVRIGEKTVALAALESEYLALQAKEEELNAVRRQMDGQSPPSVLRQIEKLRLDVPQVGYRLRAIQSVLESFTLVASNPVRFETISYDEHSRIITLIGDVEGRATSAVKLLASFVDGLRHTAAFSSVSEPEYAEHLLPDGRIIAPFTLTLSL